MAGGPAAVDARWPEWFNRAVPRSTPRALSRAGIGIAMAVVTLGLIEVGLRLAGVQPAYRPEVLGQWRTSGSQNGSVIKGPRDGHDFRLTTNADGLRTAVPVERQPGLSRYALMGDSTVFGWGVDDGGTIADGVLAALPAGSAEVINAGQPGYSTTMAAWLFGEAVARYKPDLVVVFIPMHDSNLVLVSDAELLRGGATATARVRVALARHSRIYQVLRKIIFTQTDSAWLLPNASSDEPRVARVSDAERDVALDGMAELAHGWGGEVAMGFLPFKADIEDGGGMNRPALGWASARSSRTGERLIDVSKCCAGERGWVLADDPGHLTREGNLGVGAAIAKALLPSAAK